MNDLPYRRMAAAIILHTAKNLISNKEKNDSWMFFFSNAPEDTAQRQHWFYLAHMEMPCQSVMMQRLYDHTGFAKLEKAFEKFLE